MGKTPGFDFTKMFGDGGVDYESVELDPQAQEIIRNSVESASQPQDQIAARLNAGIQGTGPGGQALQSDQALGQQATATAQDPSMMRAIRNQYGQAAQKGINAIVKKNEIQAPLTQADWLAKSAQMAQAKQNVAVGNYEALTQAYNDAQTARAQVISSVFSAAGAGGAAAMNTDWKSKRTGQPQQTATNAFSGPGTQSELNPDWYNA